MKYELTNITKTVSNICDKDRDKHVVHQIRALEDFGDVKAGDLGGYIESEANLSQSGSCWIYNEAIVCGEAVVKDDAKVMDETIISMQAEISKNAEIFGKAVVTGKAEITDCTQVGNTISNNKTIIDDNAQIRDSAKVMGEVLVGSNVIVKDNAKLFGIYTGKTPVGCRGYVAYAIHNAVLQDNAVVVNTLMSGHDKASGNMFIEGGKQKYRSEEKIANLENRFGKNVSEEDDFTKAINEMETPKGVVLS